MNFKEMAHQQKRRKAKEEGTLQPRPRQPAKIRRLARDRFSPGADVNDHDPFLAWNDAQPRDDLRSEEFRREWVRLERDYAATYSHKDRPASERASDPDDPLGDPENAIAFALDRAEVDDADAIRFLRDWKEGDLDNWPAYEAFVDGPRKLSP